MVKPPSTMQLRVAMAVLDDGSLSFLNVAEQDALRSCIDYAIHNTSASLTPPARGGVFPPTPAGPVATQAPPSGGSGMTFVRLAEGQRVPVPLHLYNQREEVL